MAKLYKGKDLKEKPKAVKTSQPVNLSIIVVAGNGMLIGSVLSIS